MGRIRIFYDKDTKQIKHTWGKDGPGEWPMAEEDMVKVLRLKNVDMLEADFQAGSEIKSIQVNQDNQLALDYYSNEEMIARRLGVSGKRVKAAKEFLKDFNPDASDQAGKDKALKALLLLGGHKQDITDFDEEAANDG